MIRERRNNVLRLPTSFKDVAYDGARIRKIAATRDNCNFVGRPEIPDHYKVTAGYHQRTKYGHFLSIENERHEWDNRKLPADWGESRNEMDNGFEDQNSLDMWHDFLDEMNLSA